MASDAATGRLGVVRAPLPLVALGVTVVVAGLLLWAIPGQLQTTLGDTDDAMRLVMVRALLSGETGWFHPHLARLQPPLGLDMHWSRLVDGGLAAMDRVFALALPAARAEAAMRLVWPLAWIFPAVWAVLAIVRRVGGAAALTPAVCLLIVNILLYAQWRPGRIDHHNIQIVMALAALAGAVHGGRRGGWLAGAATGLGMAVGLEALPFLAIVGASFALRFLFEPEREAPAARAYAGALLISVTLFYLAQTPPPVWTASVCDALAANLWCGIAMAAAGLLAAVAATRRRSLVVRLAALGLVGAAAGAAYLVLDPACLHGPLGGVDPRIKPIWLDHVSEMQPMLSVMMDRRSEFGVCSLVLIALGAASWLWLGRRRDGRTPAWALLGAMLAAGTAAALGADRLTHYADWFALPLIAAALGDLTRRYWNGNPVPAVALVILTSQLVLIAALGFVPGWQRPASKTTTAAEAGPSPCADIAAYGMLGRLPPGLVLAEINLGPRVLAESRSSVMAAPYHRMSFGILAAHHALAALPGEDERATRALGAGYVLDCPTQSAQHANLAGESLQARLDRWEVPAWLEPMSPRTDPLQVYRVRP
jgi:hypothetical protein